MTIKITKDDIGKDFVNRNGDRVRIVDINENRRLPHNQVLVCRLENDVLYRVRSDGSCDLTAFDLIAPYVEKRKGTFWVNVYANGCKSIYSSKDAADAGAIHSFRLACVEVNWTEGEGL